MTGLRRVLVAMTIAVLPATAGMALAQEGEAEALYGRYHQAIEVAKLCRDLEFDQAAHDRMATVVHERIQHKIGAKRLSLLTAAQREARGLVEKSGCNDSGVQELLALFDADLAPALQ